MLGNMRPPQAPPSQIEDYRSDPSKGYVSIEPADTIQFVSMNLAVPPLDDVHVRKAINFAVDKSGLQEIMGGPDSGQIIGHIALNSLENDLLLNYDPYGAPGHTGDVVAARTEMAQSRYDRDGDGVCDASPCKGLRALVHDLPFGRGVGEQIASDLRGIGIDLDVEPLDLNTLFEEITDPTQHVPLVLTLAWQKDILNASTWFEGLFSAGNGFSLLGASPDQLKEWGYSVTEVPNIDARIESCRTKVGETQLRCWVDIDQHLMENVVPWVPYAVFTMVNVVPKRIASFSYDQFANVPALDQIALVQGS
jgi:peptide/nickel transport system substrate-binding protein